MIYAKLERHGNYAIITDIIAVNKVLSPPRYIDITNEVPMPDVGWYYRNGNFSQQPGNQIIHAALNDMIQVLEDAGLVTRNF